MDGFILFIPITLTMAFNPPRIDPNTSGYSSPRHSYNYYPNLPSLTSSWQFFIQIAILLIRSDAYYLTLGDLFYSLHWMTPDIYPK